MPAFVMLFSVSFSFFMYVIPKQQSIIPKLILAAGMSAAGTLFFVIIAPKLAMEKLL